MRVLCCLGVLAACSGGQISPGMGDDTGFDGGADAGAGAGAGTDADPDAEAAVDCQSDWDPDFYGSLDPSLVTGNPYTRDAGLGTALAEARRLEEGESTDVRISVTGAVVTNVVPAGVEGQTFTIGDQSGHLLAYGVALAFSAAPGQILDFTVRRLTNHFGTLEITALEDASAGTGTSLVYVENASGTPLDYGVQGAQNVRLHGALIRNDGACGGESSCYALLHGDAETTVRTAQELSVGDCALLTAPVSQFDGSPQLDLDNPGWLQTAPAAP